MASTSPGNNDKNKNSPERRSDDQGSENQNNNQIESGFPEKALQFLEMLERIKIDSSQAANGEKLQQLSQRFLNVVDGQALCLLLPDETGRTFLPKITIGPKQQLLKTVFYNRESKIARTIFSSGEPCLFTKENNFQDDILLNELARSMKFTSVLAAPLGGEQARDGIIMLMGLPGKFSYDENDREIMGAFVKVAELMNSYLGTLHRLEEQTREMDKKDFDLYTVYQVARSLSSILDLEELTSMLTDMLVEIITVKSSFVFLSDDEEKSMNIKAHKFIDPELSCPHVTLTLSDKTHEWLLSQVFEGRIITDFDDENFKRAFPEARWLFDELGIELVVPMINKYKLVGLLALGEKYIGDEFTDRDRDFLATIAPLAANAISNSHLYEMAILDGLTRVYLGRYFQQRCKEEIKRARRYENVFSMIMWDIDYFKKVNDNHGHLVGDTVLREVADLFKKSYRQGVDIVARYGGEEFIMLLPDTPAEGAYIMAERLRKTVEKYPFCNGRVHLTISGGISSFPGDGDNYIALMEQADIHLYRAKKAGRNKVCSNVELERSEKI